MFSSEIFENFKTVSENTSRGAIELHLKVLHFNECL